jgi:3-oxoacyl-[acyl-carrier-protein] synthase II
MAAFANMMALSKRSDDPTKVSRPWDSARDGFLLGEGAGILVLESLEHAQARGARIYAEAAGAGITADSHDIAQPDPVGAGARRAISRALMESDLSASDIRHINAHATSTPQGDVAEILALHGALGDAADDVILTGTKSMTGHLLGAAGALESIATVLALHHRRIPPTINLDDRDPAVDMEIATEVRDLPVGDLAALNNSFGFGGHNVAVAFKTV